MPLIFDDFKNLTPGIHEASLSEVDEAFGRMQKSDRRIKLMALLKSYIEALKKADLPVTIVIDGSFVMGRIDEPSDIDVVVTLPPSWDFSAEPPFRQYQLLSKNRVRRAYRIEVYPVPDASIAENQWFDFFGQVNPKWCKAFGWPIDLKKGIVRIVE